MPGISVRPSISASNSPPGTGISSTWCGCSCLYASTYGATGRIDPDGLCYKGAAVGVAPFAWREHFEHMQGQTLPTITETALRGLACKCPHCGKGKLYAGFLDLRANCESCGLDFAFIDTGD